MTKLSAFLKVSRANLLLTSIGHATLGLFIGADHIVDLLTLNVLFYILLHYSIAFLACNTNCLYDYHVDKRYKTYMSRSVDVLGKKTLKSIIVIEIILSGLFTSYFFINGFFITSLLAALGIIAAIIYSAEPIRLKKRGYFSPFLIVSLYMLPILGGWFIFKQTLPYYFVLFVIGYAFMNEGFTLVNVCEDYSEDKKEKIKTLAHTIGLKKTLNFAYYFCLLGLLCVIGLLGKIFEVYNFQNHPISFLFLIITLFLILFAAFEVGNVRKGDNLEQNCKLFGVKLQKWFMITRYPLMITAILLLL